MKVKVISKKGFVRVKFVTSLATSYLNVLRVLMYVTWT